MAANRRVGMVNDCGGYKDSGARREFDDEFCFPENDMPTLHRIEVSDRSHGTPSGGEVLEIRVSTCDRLRSEIECNAPEHGV